MYSPNQARNTIGYQHFTKAPSLGWAEHTGKTVNVMEDLNQNQEIQKQRPLILTMIGNWVKQLINNKLHRIFKV